MASPNPTQPAAGTRHPVQLAAMVVSVVFLLVGLLGFIPGLTTSYDQLMIAGHESEALLLGLFQVSILHNIVHLAFGVAGLLLARTAAGAQNFLIYGGVIYAVLWIYGLLVDQESASSVSSDTDDMPHAAGRCHQLPSAGPTAHTGPAERHRATPSALQTPLALVPATRPSRACTTGRAARHPVPATRGLHPSPRAPRVRDEPEAGKTEGARP